MYYYRQEYIFGRIFGGIFEEFMSYLTWIILAEITEKKNSLLARKYNWYTHGKVMLCWFQICLYYFCTTSRSQMATDIRIWQSIMI